MNSDKKIWDDFRKGKNYALGEIYHQNVQLLFRYGKKFTSDEELIKDIIQDLFFDLIKTRARLGETDNIRFYLMSSFRRKLAKELNKKNRLLNDFLEDEIVTNIVYSAEQELIDKEELTQQEQLIKDALQKLSPKEREILFYRYSCELNYNSICKIMNLKYDSARKQVSRALTRIKKTI